MDGEWLRPTGLEFQARSRRDSPGGGCRANTRLVRASATASPDDNLGQQTLDWLLSQGCGGPYQLLVTQCHNPPSARGSAGVHTLLLGLGRPRTIHLRNRGSWPGPRGLG